MKLLGRRCRVYAIAWYCHRQYTQAEKKTKEAKLTAAEKAAIWDETHAHVSSLVCSQILALEGLWVKLGQYLSTRPDVLPDVWVQNLAELQDALPARPFSD